MVVVVVHSVMALEHSRVIVFCLLPQLPLPAPPLLLAFETVHLFVALLVAAAAAAFRQLLC